MYKNLSDDIILKESVNNGVTSKMGTDHMGLGLYLIKNICAYNSRHLKIFSEGQYYELLKRNEKIKKVGFWKGTIIYLRLELQNITKLCNIPELQATNRHKIIWR